MLQQERNSKVTKEIHLFHPKKCEGFNVKETTEEGLNFRTLLGLSG